tara:strand:+ start:424 stop:900 length:477 start_codon:yes stop_codon:yes gene_type:complete
MKQQDLINHFYMQPHPEGGFFVETYRSELEIDTTQGKRNASTAIHFLITKDSISHLHRLTSDEGWHYHIGDPLLVIEISPKGELIKTIMGPDIFNGHKLQHIVPAGNWFASTSTGEFSFVGCTVAPGFDFSDFEMGKKENLLKKYPNLAKEIEAYSLN